MRVFGRDAETSGRQSHQCPTITAASRCSPCSIVVTFVLVSVSLSFLLFSSWECEHSKKIKLKKNKNGRSGVDGISLPTFPVTGTESPVHAYFGDDRISLPKYVFADASYHLFAVYSNLISSSSPYFFPNLPLYQGVVYIIRRILVRYGTDTGASKYCGQVLCTIL